MSRLEAALAVFVASGSVLVLEIVGLRMLAPYSGITLEATTAVIGIVLAAIALGAYLGGRAADRAAPRRLVGPAFVAGAALVAVAPVLVHAIGAASRDRDLGTATAIPVALAALFLPALVLSAIPPIVAKLRLRELAHAGEVVGGLSAAGTAGALAGTFTTGFVLVAELASTTILLALSGALAVAGVGYWHRAGGAGLGTAAAFALVAVVPPATVAAAVRSPCGRETRYHCATVERDPGHEGGRTLILDTLHHAYVDLDDPTHLEFAYIRAFAAAVDAAAPPGPLAALHLGGGGFTMPRWLAATRPGSRSTVLEVDPGVVDIGHAALALDEVPGVDVRVGDARLTLRATPPGTFDLVVGDAFGGLAVPWHLTTREFARDVAARLAPGGIYVLNVIDYPPFAFARAELATLRAVFGDVVLLARPSAVRGETGGNLVLVAADDPLDRGALRAALAGEEHAAVVADDALDRFTGDAEPLTDAFAPVDQLLSRRPE